MICCWNPKDPAAMIEAVLKAVRNGEVKEEHIDQAVRKLLFWKARLGLHQVRFTDEAQVNAIVGAKAHLDLAQEVADRSVTVLKNDGVLPLRRGGVQNIVNISIQKLENDPAPDAGGEAARGLPGPDQLHSSAGHGRRGLS